MGENAKFDDASAAVLIDVILLLIDLLREIPDCRIWADADGPLLKCRCCSDVAGFDDLTSFDDAAAPYVLSELRLMDFYIVGSHIPSHRPGDPVAFVVQRCSGTTR